MKDAKNVEVGRKERLWGDVLRARTGVGCTSGADLIAFVEGRLDPVKRAGVIRHLGHCAGCRGIVLELRATERAVHAKSRVWRGFLIGNRFAIAAAAGFVLVAAAVWTAKSPELHSGDAVVAIHGGKAGAPNAHRESNPTKVASKESKPGSTAHVTMPPNSSGDHTHSTQSKPTGNGSPERTLVARNDGGGTSETGTRALKMCLLLGANHVYKLDSKDSHQDERRKIEEQYADQVAAKQEDCSQAIEQGADPDGENEHLKQALDELSDDRDAQLAALYPVVDDVRETHPELQVEGNGPYQVVEVNYHEDAQVPVFDEYEVDAPWPGYSVVDVPYGWTYGQRYHPTEFRSKYVSWHDTHIGAGRPVFYGLHGSLGPVEVHAIIRGQGSRYSYRRTVGTARSSKVGVVTADSGNARSAKYGNLGGPSRYNHKLSDPISSSRRYDRRSSGPAPFGASGKASRYSEAPDSFGNGPRSAPQRVDGPSRYSSPHGSSTFGNNPAIAPRSSGSSSRRSPGFGGSPGRSSGRPANGTSGGSPRAGGHSNGTRRGGHG